MDCGIGNCQRYINVSNIADVLEERRPGLPRALPAYHAFTGSDFTSAFYRKGKLKALDIVEKDTTGRFLKLFCNMGDANGDIDFDTLSEFVCLMYGQTKTKLVDEARYSKLMQMSGKIDQDSPLSNIKKIDCALLPPSSRTLKKKLQRACYVSILWNHADTACPGEGLMPIDYGWSNDGNLLHPKWFEGQAFPDILFADRDVDSHLTGDNMHGDEQGDELSDDEPWSKGSDQDDSE